MLLNFEWGDFSQDGHEQIETFLFKCSHNRDQVESSYLKGSELLGFNLVDDVATEYLSWGIPEEISDILVKANCPVDFDVDEIFPSEWCELYLWIAHYGDNNITYSSYEDGLICIGGYGLFQ